MFDATRNSLKQIDDRGHGCTSLQDQSAYEVRVFAVTSFRVNFKTSLYTKRLMIDAKLL